MKGVVYLTGLVLTLILISFEAGAVSTGVEKKSKRSSFLRRDSKLMTLSLRTSTYRKTEASERRASDIFIR
jgi:hypothetical protein